MGGGWKFLLRDVFPGRRLRAVALLAAALLALLAVSLRAVEVSPYVALDTVPALGIYQIEPLRTFINVDPDLTRGYGLVSDFHFEQALPWFRKVVARADASPKLRSEAAAWLGYALFSLRRREAAVQALRQALRLNPRNDVAHFFLANELYLDGNPQAVKDELLEAVRLRPSFVSALRMLAEAYKDEGKAAEAIDRYAQIVKLLPNSGYYRFQLYRSHNDAGRYREARDDLDAMIRLEPNFALNYFRLGQVALKLGDEKSAHDAFERVVAVGGHAFDHLSFLGNAQIHLARGELGQARAMALRARERRPDSQDIRDTLLLIEQRMAEARTVAVRRAVVGGGAVIAIGLVAWAIAFANRKKYVLSLIAKFNQAAERIYDQEELAQFLLSFFTDLLGRPKGLVLVFNRQNNVLTSGELVGCERFDRIQVVPGNEVIRWTARATRPAYALAGIDPAFEDAFPSLLGRLQALGFEVVIPFREKSSFLGFLALGPRTARAAAGGDGLDGDLLEPLVTTAAQSLETLYLYESSMLDETTGLFNKRYFKQQLATEVKRADRYQQPCSVLTFDLDDFKKINDTYGHSQGDQVLRELGRIVHHAIREGIDTAARTGGEEFHLILPATSTERAETVAERLRQAVEEHPFSGFTKPVKVTISVGVATYPDHARGEHELVGMSDEAQYQAKRTGKNRVCGAGQIERTAEAVQPRAPALESRFDQLNIVDERSGLRNFTYFSLRLREEIKRVARYGFPCSLLVMRLDADLADEARPQVLKQLGVLLKETLREGIDTPARLEGDELAVILPETPVHRAMILAERLHALACSRTFQPLPGPVGIHMGVASYPECSLTDNELLEAAVGAMRAAQQADDAPVRQAPLLPGR